MSLWILEWVIFCLLSTVGLLQFVCSVTKIQPQMEIFVKKKFVSNECAQIPYQFS